MAKEVVHKAEHVINQKHIAIDVTVSRITKHWVLGTLVVRDGLITESSLSAEDAHALVVTQVGNHFSAIVVRLLVVDFNFVSILKDELVLSKGLLSQSLVRALDLWIARLVTHDVVSLADGLSTLLVDGKDSLALTVWDVVFGDVLLYDFLDTSQRLVE